MREILFRGKQCDNGEWVEGALLNDKDGPSHICPCVDHMTYGENGRRKRMGSWYQVDPESVGQYTGLKDKNGQRIFEGDVFSVTWRAEGRTPVVKSYVAVFKDGCFYARVFGGNQIVAVIANYANCGKVGNTGVFVEVIGNIHDNPELLKRR